MASLMQSEPEMEKKPVGIRFLERIKGSKLSYNAYQAIVLIVTFLAYASYHAARKTTSIVKSALDPQSPDTGVNSLLLRFTSFRSFRQEQENGGWAPFNGPNGTVLLGEIDVAFLAVYAFGMYFAGHLGDRMNLRIFLTVGMVGTGLFTSLFGVGYWANVHSFYYFLIMQMLAGLFQSSGWPSVVAVVGNWFNKKKRGLIMGIWNAHTSVGNITGSLIAAAMLRYGWGWSFVVPGVVIALIGLVNFAFLPVNPEMVGAERDEDVDSSSEKIGDSVSVPLLLSSSDSETDDKKRAVGFIEAWRIPGVAPFALCLFFAKLVAYTFLYWLPFYVSHTAIEGEYLSDETAGNLSTMFDVGGVVGGIMAGLGNDTESCDGSSRTGEVLPFSAGMEMEVSPDFASKVCLPGTIDESLFEDTLDDETPSVTVANAVSGVDSRSADVDNEQSCAFGTTAEVSVSESHEDTLENGMSAPTELDSMLTSAFNSGGEKSMGYASPSCSRFDEQISDIPAEFHSSHIHDEGVHDLPGLDNISTDIVPKEDLAVSDNHADISSDDEDHAVSLSSTSMKGSLPWRSTNTSKSSSEATDSCHDTAVESNGILPAKNNSALEKTVQESPLEASSEGLGTSLDNNDLAGSESVSPMISLDQSNRDRETKSPCESIPDENGIDSLPANNMNLTESLTTEPSVKVQTPCVSHALEDEELKQSSVSRGLEFVPQSAGIEWNNPKQELNLDPIFPSFGLIPETTTPNQEDMPPLPPLPPMQWRIGKAPQSFLPNFMGELGETSSSAPSAAPPSGSSLNVQMWSTPELSESLGREKSEQLPGESMTSESEKPLHSSIQFPSVATDLNSQYDSFGSQRTQSADPSIELLAIPNHGSIEDVGSEENNLLADHTSQNQELVYSQESSLQLPQEPSAKNEDFEDDTDVQVSETSRGQKDCPETEALTPPQSAKVEDNGHSDPDASSAEIAEPSNSSVQKTTPASVGDAMWPVNAFTVAPTLDTDKLEEVPMVKLPRPRSPLVDAVAAHDRRTLKKVSERVQPPIKSKQDDKDSLLAQIRNKSVSLKPAVATRPSIQTGPKTNLRVAAILEKANTIRQAMAGSDEDEDSDSWSDS